MTPTHSHHQYWNLSCFASKGRQKGGNQKVLKIIKYEDFSHIQMITIFHSHPKDTNLKTLNLKTLIFKTENPGLVLNTKFSYRNKK